MTQLQHMADNVRLLHVAIAHALVSTRASDQERLALLNRLFQNLTCWEQTMCRIEIAECRAARRALILRDKR